MLRHVFDVCVLAFCVLAGEAGPQATPDGCRLLGMLFVARVPGSLTISVHSDAHSFDHSIINLAHDINFLSFGEPLADKDEVW